MNGSRSHKKFLVIGKTAKGADKKIKMSSQAQLVEKISKAFNESWDLINTRSGWHPAKAMFLRSPHLDKIEWKRRRTGGSGSNRKSSGIVYRVTATVPGPKEKVVALLRDVNNIASWNRTLQVGRWHVKEHKYGTEHSAHYNLGGTILENWKSLHF